MPTLARHFLQPLVRDCPACRNASFSDRCTLAALQAYDWAGNVRQLRNLMDWLLIMAPGGSVRPDPRRHAAAGGRLGRSVAERQSGGADIMALPLREARDLFETQYLQAQLLRFGGNISRTAGFVGMERSALHRKLKQLGISSEDRNP